MARLLKQMLTDLHPQVLQDYLHELGRLDHGTLPIQGPPGTGKTYVSSHAILALTRMGKRVAVTSNSHKAIDNLLTAVVERAREAERRAEGYQENHKWRGSQRSGDRGDY